MLIFCKVLFDLTTAELWGHPDFEAFKFGYNIQVEYGNAHSRRFLSVSAPPISVPDAADNATGSSSPLSGLSHS